MNKSLLLLLILTIFPSTFGQDTLQIDTDTQLWSDTQLIFGLDGRTDLTFAGTLRVGDTFKRVIDQRIGTSLSRRLNKNFSVGGGYLYRKANLTFGQKRYEHRFTLNTTVSVPFEKSYTFSFRNQYEYRAQHSRSDSQLYRLRPRPERKIKAFGKETKAFWFIEPFYDLRKKEFTRVQSAVGIRHDFTRKFSADIFYLLQNELENRSETSNILGTILRIRLR